MYFFTVVFHFGSLHLGHYKMRISNITLHLFNLSLHKRYDKFTLRSHQEFPGDPRVRIWLFHCQGQVQSLVGELRSCKLHREAKKKKKKKRCIFLRDCKKKMYIFKRRYGMEREYRLNWSIFSTQSPLAVSHEIPQSTMWYTYIQQNITRLLKGMELCRLQRCRWTWGLPGGTSGKEPAYQCKRHKRFKFDPQVGKIPWKRALATHSSILAWRIPWTEEPGGLQSIGSQRIGHN